jgi:uncharacterized small protein (DUF1192 family)
LTDKLVKEKKELEAKVIALTDEIKRLQSTATTNR